MIESRCGLLCSECKYRDIMKCPGCLKIKKPYWGKSCPIKNCCESKGKVHCGQCDRFPCKQLHEFAYDPATGSEGTRIEQLTDWGQELPNAEPRWDDSGALAEGRQAEAGLCGYPRAEDFSPAPADFRS